MLDVAMPDNPEVPILTRSFAACLASAVELPLDGVPLPRLDLPLAVAR